MNTDTEPKRDPIPPAPGREAWSTSEWALNDFGQHLERIAVRNGANFSIRVSVSAIDSGSTFTVDAAETEDDNILVVASATDITAAVNDARAKLKDACDEWGYDYVE